MSETQRPTQRPHPWEKEAEAEAPSFGGWLRRQREMRQIALREIADATKISLRYLEAFEQDRFDVLPAPVFAKGFLREYARYVGLDPDEVVNAYLTSGRENEPTEVTVTAVPRQRKTSEWTSGLLVAFAVAALLALVAFLAFYAERAKVEEVREPPPIAAPVREIVAEPPVPESELEPEMIAALVVTMDFSENCWVEVVVDGRPRLSALYVQGESLRLEAEESVRLTLGNPTGVHLEANGEPFEPELTPGRVARDIEINLADLKPLAESD